MCRPISAYIQHCASAIKKPRMGALLSFHSFALTWVFVPKLVLALTRQAPRFLRFRYRRIAATTAATRTPTRMIGSMTALIMATTPIRKIPIFVCALSVDDVANCECVEAKQQEEALAIISHRSLLALLALHGQSSQQPTCRALSPYRP